MACRSPAWPRTKPRAAREARGQTLQDVSATTRISVRYLEAIEADEALDAAQKQQQIEELNAQWAKDHALVTSLGGLRIIVIDELA